MRKPLIFLRKKAGWRMLASCGWDPWMVLVMIVVMLIVITITMMIVMVIVMMIAMIVMIS